MDLTPEQINRLMAEKVMVFLVEDTLKLYYRSPEMVILIADWDPYHRIEHAMMALEKFKTWEFGKNEDPVPYYCVIDFDKSIGVADTPSAAICEAIAKALE